MGDFVMPSLGADMDSGTLVEWRVQAGEAVHRGDIVAVVDTDKATIEVEVFEDGVVTELLAAPGDELPVGAPLAHIGPPQAAPPPDDGKAPALAPPTTAASGGGNRQATPVVMPPENEEATAPAARPDLGETTVPPGAPEAGGPAPGEPASPVPAAPTSPRRRRAPRKAPARARGQAGAATAVRASPLARRRAREEGIDLAEVDGSGPGGAVVAADVERTRGAEAPATTGPRPRAATGGTAAGGSDRQAAMRRATAALMARSKREIPHYYLATTVDLAAATAWLERANAARPVTERLLPGVLLLRATALAARRVPALNGYWEDGFRPAAAVHLGVAVSLRGGGLVAPAIHDADSRSLDELMAALRDLVARARAGTLRSSDVADPTITVTNLGDQGVDEVHGVIYPPQVALVGFGKVAERPWASGGMLGVRPTVRATLAADHRATDGLVGARFLNTLDRLLQAPEEL